MHHPKSPGHPARRAATPGCRPRLPRARGRAAGSVDRGRHRPVATGRPSQVSLSALTEIQCSLMLFGCECSAPSLRLRGLGRPKMQFSLRTRSLILKRDFERLSICAKKIEVPSRLYRSRFLRVNFHFAAFFNLRLIYTESVIRRRAKRWEKDEDARPWALRTRGCQGREHVCKRTRP